MSRKTKKGQVFISACRKIVASRSSLVLSSEASIIEESNKQASSHEKLNCQRADFF